MFAKNERGYRLDEISDEYTLYSIHAKLEPANTIIDIIEEFKNEWEIFLGHPVEGNVNIFFKNRLF